MVVHSRQTQGDNGSDQVGWKSMTSLLAERAAEVVAAAQQLLARRMGAPVRLSDPVELGGSGRTIVLRVRVTENAYSLPRTLVAKQVNGSAYHSADTDRDLDSAFIREAVAYQFATALGPRTPARPTVARLRTRVSSAGVDRPG